MKKRKKKLVSKIYRESNCCHAPIEEDVFGRTVCSKCKELCLVLDNEKSKILLTGVMDPISPGHDAPIWQEGH